MARYCRNCGRPLQEGEICTCTSGQNNSQKTGNMPRITYPQTREGTGTGRTGRQSGPSPEEENNYNDSQDQGYYYDSDEPYESPYGSSENSSRTYEQRTSGESRQRSARPGGTYGNRSTGTGYENRNTSQGNRNYENRARDNQWFNEKKDAFVSSTKNVFAQILPILKKPVSHVSALARSGSSAVGIELLIAQTITCILLVLVIVFRGRDLVYSLFYSLSYYADYYSYSPSFHIPYFQIILIVAVIIMGAGLLRSLIQSFVSTALFRVTYSFPAAVTIVGAGSLYHTIVALVSALLCLFSVKTLSVWLIGEVVAGLLSTFIEYHNYAAVARGEKDRKPYAYVTGMVINSLVVGLIVYLLIEMFF